MTGSALLVLVLAQGTFGAPVQELDPPGEQSALEAAAGRFAEAWSGGDVGALAGLLDPHGVRLHFGEERHGVLPPRRILASVRELVEGNRTSRIRIDRVSEAGGAPARGYAEIGWDAVPRGGTEVLAVILFVEFTREEEAWKVSELRVLR